MQRNAHTLGAVQSRIRLLVFPVMSTASRSDKGTSKATLRANGVLLPRISMLLICTAYVAAFVLVYKCVIVPVWGYEGFRYKTSPAHAAAAWVLAGLPSLWMPIK